MRGSARRTGARLGREVGELLRGRARRSWRGGGGGHLLLSCKAWVPECQQQRFSAVPAARTRPHLFLGCGRQLAAAPRSRLGAARARGGAQAVWPSCLIPCNRRARDVPGERGWDRDDLPVPCLAPLQSLVAGRFLSSRDAGRVHLAGPKRSSVPVVTDISRDPERFLFPFASDRHIH